MLRQGAREECKAVLWVAVKAYQHECVHKECHSKGSRGVFRCEQPLSGYKGSVAGNNKDNFKLAESLVET